MDINGIEVEKFMEVTDEKGINHPIYCDSFASKALLDVFSKLNYYEAEEASKNGHNS